VYIIHAPIIVGLAILMRHLEWQHLLKFALLAIIALPMCFDLAGLIRRLPMAPRVV
jgi:hypothetical protein